MTSSHRPAAAALILVALVALVAAGCSDPAAPAAPGAGAAPYAVHTVGKAGTPGERRYDGILEASAQGMLTAQTAGRVVALPYDVNDQIPAGAVLVRLQGTEQRAGLAQAESAVKEASARALEASTRHQRIADMQARNVVARATLDEATANRDAAVAREAAARAQLAAAREGVAYTEVRAPYAGVLTARHVQVGESVAPGSPLVSTLSMRALRVVADLPQADATALRTSGKAVLYIGDQRIEAAQVTVFPVASTGTSTVRVRLDLPAAAAGTGPALYPGMYVKVGVPTDAAARLSIPASALVQRDEVAAVYVWDPRGGTRLRQVRIGARAGADVEVLAGLAAGEQVALDPAVALQQLRTARQVGSTP
jgi:RND family efflux transporter MFP subunit